MATTIEPEADPSFLAYERARQAADSTLKTTADTTQARAAEDYQSGGLKLALQGTQAIDKNMADFRATGFGQSGLRAQSEDRIRQDIALQAQDILKGYTRTSQDATASLEDQLAQSAYEKAEQEIAARKRLTQDNATAGVGI